MILIELPQKDYKKEKNRENQYLFGSKWRRGLIHDTSDIEADAEPKNTFLCFRPLILQVDMEKQM